MARVNACSFVSASTLLAWPLIALPCSIMDPDAATPAPPADDEVLCIPDGTCGACEQKFHDQDKAY